LRTGRRIREPGHEHRAACRALGRRRRSGRPEDKSSSGASLPGGARKRHRPRRHRVAWRNPQGRRGKASGAHVTGVLQTLIPIKAWLTDPTLRQWPKLLIAVYALAPVVLLIPLQTS